MTELFKEGIKTFGYEEYIDVFFNLFLVTTKSRKATLIESANDKPFYTKITKWLDKRLVENNLKTIEIGTGSFYPQLIIFNSELVSVREVINLSKNVEGIGKLLGFGCAGELGGKYILSFKINGKEFYTESCFKPPKESFSRKNYEIFSKAAKMLSSEIIDFFAEITYDVISLLTIDDWIEIFSSSQLEIETIFETQNIFEQKSDLSDIFSNTGMNITSEKIDSFENKELFLTWCKKYSQFILFSLCYIKNDPLQIFYPLSDKQEKQTNKIFEKIETQFFSY
jgi:hypothetical protein